MADFSKLLEKLRKEATAHDVGSAKAKCPLKCQPAIFVLVARADNASSQSGIPVEISGATKANKTTDGDGMAKFDPVKPGRHNIKLALTEEDPVIKPYDEARWAELPDVAATPIETSLTLLECLHRRWVLLLRALRPPEWGRRIRHPEHNRTIDLDELLALYAWHGRHHVAHITSLRTRMGWD